MSLPIPKYYQNLDYSKIEVKVTDKRHDRQMVAVTFDVTLDAMCDGYSVPSFTVLIPYEAYRNIGVTACLQAGARKGDLRALRCRIILGALAQGAKYLGCSISTQKEACQ